MAGLYTGATGLWGGFTGLLFGSSALSTPPGLLADAASSFSPASLFANGEQGAWYDPSDFSTMFQDSAGTTPVTAVEQPVGLLLDKSKGGRQSLAVTGWAQTSGDGTVTVDGGTITITGATTTTRVDVAAPGWAIGNYADITVTGSVAGATGPTLFLGGGTAYSTLSGTNTFRNVIASSTLLRLQISTGSATYVVTSRGYVPGNHASQSTAASRPVLSARVNLLTYSEAIASSFITGGTATLTNNQAVTPSGAPATRFVPTTANSAHYATYSPTFGAGTFTFSLEVKAAGYPRIGLRVYDSVAYRIYATIDLTTGLPVGTPTGTVTTTDLGDGWWKISVQSEASTSNMGSTTGWDIESLPSGVTVQSAFTGDGTSGMFVSKVDIRVTNVGVGLPAYQRVAAATDYDTSGFPLFLRFDGTDDSLATGTIDFTATDKMSVFAGVRKLSDAALGVMAELSANSDSTNGTFNLYNNATTQYFAVNNRGTAIVGVGTSSATYAGPYSAVLNGNLSITPAGTTLRVNGTQVATSATTVGTGNYANVPLYIGRRNNASLPYNGNLYSLIVRGALSTDAQIASTETWVNGKTKAY